MHKSHRFDIKNPKIFWGGGYPDPTPSGKGDTPSPHPTPLGAFGASSLNPPLKISGYATGLESGSSIYHHHSKLVGVTRTALQSVGVGAGRTVTLGGASVSHKPMKQILFPFPLPHSLCVFSLSFRPFRSMLPFHHVGLGSLSSVLSSFTGLPGQSPDGNPFSLRESYLVLSFYRLRFPLNSLIVSVFIVMFVLFFIHLFSYFRCK